MRKFFNQPLLTALLCYFAILGNAQSAFITDKVIIDIYADKSPQSAVIKSLPSGTVIEVLARQDDYSKVRTTDKVVGWVESKYLTNEKPTQLEYLQLVAKYNTLNEKIADYQTRLLTMQELRKEAKSAEWLRDKLNHAQDSQKQLEQTVRNKDIVIADLRETVKNINHDLDETKLQLNEILESMDRNNNTPTQTRGSLISSINTPTNLYTWLTLILLVTLVIGILMGFVLIDYKVRKKHGGVRLY